MKKQQKLVRKQHRQKKISMTKGLTDEEETLAMMTPHQYEDQSKSVPFSPKSSGRFDGSSLEILIRDSNDKVKEFK